VTSAPVAGNSRKRLIDRNDAAFGIGDHDRLAAAFEYLGRQAQLLLGLALPGVVAGGALDTDHIARCIADEMRRGQHPYLAAILVPQARLAADDMTAIGLHAGQKRRHGRPANSRNRQACGPSISSAV
jgi:hypothetical protein